MTKNEVHYSWLISNRLHVERLGSLMTNKSGEEMCMNVSSGAQDAEDTFVPC